ncbi:MAG: prepilin-type N-terminal cleavage/methylation domain-containing protein [Candidatus Methylomirabilis sp.]|nr:prepilin-type N-terminal cleavage/methylation domain-containing protein [Deltaproteobacteria bacterium]
MIGRTRGRRAALGEEGFTLIELLFASLVLSVGFMAMVKLQYTSTRANARAGSVSEAVMLAEQAMETVKMTPYDSVTAGSFPAEAYGTIAGYPRVRRATTIQTNTPGSGRKTVTVTASFMDRGVERSVSLASIVRDD